MGRRLRRAGCKGRVVQLKLKLSDFSLLTRQTTLEEPSDDGQTIYRAAAELLGRLELGQRVRLTGVSAQGIVAPQEQLSALRRRPEPLRAPQRRARQDHRPIRHGRPC